MASITDYAFEELNEGSGRGIIPEDGQPPEATRCFKIAWTDLGAFIVALKGGWKAINATTYTHYTPDRHPDWPQMYCVSAAWEGLGLPSQNSTTKVSSWEYAKITATYMIPLINVGSIDISRIIDEEFDFKIDVISLPEGSLTTDPGGDAVPGETTLKVPTLDYTVTMPALPALPGGSIGIVMALLGRMNSATFGGAAVGKMLFLGMRASRKGAIITNQSAIANSNALDTNSGRAWAVQLKFCYRDVNPWDYIYVPGTGWTKAKYTDGGLPLYASGNLNVLLPSSPPP